MPNNITLSSFNQILGTMIRTIIAETPLNDVNAGSVLLTLLEACANQDFENNTAILNVLELLNINALSNSDLDNAASNLGLTRMAANTASGQVNLLNTNITKLSTSLYVLIPPPISGQTVIYVNDASKWTPTGTIYIGRGTNQFEGPIGYSSLVNNITYWTVNLTSALQNNHLASDSVINAQGQPDYIVTSGTLVQIPANNISPAIQFTILNDTTIPAGEDIVTGVNVIAVVAGSAGNAAINTVTAFVSPPFPGAGVTNTSSFSNGTNVETDLELRNRIIQYPSTLARGTASAIINAVIGLSDPSDNNQIASAVITEPLIAGAPSIMIIDDGTGLQPTEAGQSVDTLLTDAVGTEQFLQLSNYPLPRPQAINTATAPYAMVSGMNFTVIIDGVAEEIQFQTSDFVNINAATVAEVITAINNKALTFSARFCNNSNNILVYPVVYNAEILQVAPLLSTENPTFYANGVLDFPTTKNSFIELFQNSTRLYEKEISATLTTVPYGLWNVVSAEDLVISVDGTPSQDQVFALSAFPGAQSFTDLTLAQWVTAFNDLFAGITAVATTAQQLQITSNRQGSGSSLSINGGSLIGPLFSGQPTEATGQSSQFALNRQTGNLEILTVIKPGDNITAGVVDARGFVTSYVTTSGTYDVAPDANGRPAIAIVVADSTRCDQRTLPLAVGDTITISDQGAGIMRVMSETLTAFADLLPGDFVYITPVTTNWLAVNNTGLFRMQNKGFHTNPGVDTYIEVLNGDITPQVKVVLDSQDIQAFVTDGYPQIWNGEYTTNPSAATLGMIVTSFETYLVNVIASISNSDSIKLTSTTESGGSIAIPISIANGNVLFAETPKALFGNPPLIANIVSSKDLISYFKRVPIITSTWLNREFYADIKGPLSADATPYTLPPTLDTYPFTGVGMIAPYSEILTAPIPLNPTNVREDDIINFTRGDNRGQFKPIASLITSPADSAGTQEGNARTQLDHIVGDEIDLLRPMQFSTEDTIVFVMDNNPQIETVNIPMAREGQVNSLATVTSTEFSANDIENQAGVNFSNLVTWGTAQNGTNFSDYKVWMQARNWYSTGGLPQTAGAMIIRSAEFGPNGHMLRFNIGYPTIPNAVATTKQDNTPSFNTVTYYFGSGSARTVPFASNDTITVTGPYLNPTSNFPAGAPSGGNYFDYTFSTNLLSSGIQSQIPGPGDVLSILSTAGVSSFNSGQFGVANISGDTIRVFNPLGSVTSPGGPEMTTFTTVADIVGSPTSYNVTTVADSSYSLNGEYFTINDTAGSVGVWFSFGPVPAVQPSMGTNRAIVVSTLLENDTAITVANKIYATLIQDAAFNNVGTSQTGNVVTINNSLNGALAAGSAGTSGFTVVTLSPGLNIDTLNGKYFIIYDQGGPVSVWFNVDNGSTLEPADGSYRSIEVSTINLGDSATTVAADIAAQVNLDSQFLATSIGRSLVITTRFNGTVPNANAGTSGFGGPVIVPGSLPAPEVITTPPAINIFPLTGTAVSSIVATINAGQVITATAVGSPAAIISLATDEEDYAYVNNSTALGYGHNPTSSTLRNYIGLYDGEDWVKNFQNTNPNFTLKRPLILLQTVLVTYPTIPTIIDMNTAPNPDASIGEKFQLIPDTVQNIYHQFTQPALSQLPIIADVSVSDDRKNVQVVSMKLGSEGGVQILGGRANTASQLIIGESQVVSDINGPTLLLQVPAFPDTFNVGDYVTLQNATGVERLSRLEATDQIDVVSNGQNIWQYEYNPKVINTTSASTFTITDNSALYSRPAGTVWRWTASSLVSFNLVNPGDLLYVFGAPLTGWAQGNKAQLTGDSEYAGLPIIAVSAQDAIVPWIDVVNPYGQPMSTTAIGAGGTVQICPTPIIEWTTKQAARVQVVSLHDVLGTVTVSTSGLHYLNSTNSFTLKDSVAIPDGTYGPVTVTGPQTFTFAYAGSFLEGQVGASILLSSDTVTRYRIETLGFNGLTRLAWQDGNNPGFVDCGIAVDDYIRIGGSTFESSNNGLFRVLAADNNSIVYDNPSSVEEVDTIVNFNNQGLLASWTTNNPLVTGVAGTFKYVAVGDWVKKPADPDTSWVQVLGFSPTSPALATTMTLGSNYPGTSEQAAGVAYNEAIDHDKGVYLQGNSDVAFFEGDSVINGDTLTVQNIVNPSWFNVTNTGTFVIAANGTDPVTYSPFLRVVNPLGLAQSDVQMSVSVGGMFITENSTDGFKTNRVIQNIILDDLHPTMRDIYVTPASRSYKFSQANQTSIVSLGKLNYSSDPVTGIDGYLYYTGLLQKAQRVVDGYAPDSTDYPGMRAIGGMIEILPPIVQELNLTITVTTNIGVNLGDISNNIKSVMINYVESLGVGDPVVLSEIITAVQGVNGVASVNFVSPAPSTQSIPIANNQKAILLPQNIGIA